MTHDLALGVLRRLRRRPDADVPLAALARATGGSRFQVQRGFARLAGESPKAYTLRLRLEHAAAQLAASDARVLDIALDRGFASHEVFTRAFTRHFGRTPSAYRAAARVATVTPEARTRHRQVVDTVGPCLRLFHVPTQVTTRTAMPTLSIERQEIAAQPVLFVRARSARHELAAAIGAGVGQSYMQAQKAGLAMAGPPYHPLSVDVGGPAHDRSRRAAGRAGQRGRRSGSGGAAGRAGRRGDACRALRAAVRDLRRHRAMDRGAGAAPDGAPWESYLTDPADHPESGRLAHGRLLADRGVAGAAADVRAEL